MVLCSCILHVAPDGVQEPVCRVVSLRVAPVAGLPPRPRIVLGLGAGGRLLFGGRDQGAPHSHRPLQG